MTRQHIAAQAGQHQAAGMPAQSPAAGAAATTASGPSPMQQQQQQQQPSRYSQQLQQQARGSNSGAAPAADCMGCRLTGLALGVVGGGYVAARLFEQPYPKGAHKLALVSVSAGLFALGVGRALGF